MFCPNCGKGEQTPDAYCRNCGEYLANFSDKFSLINKVLGVNTPEKQVNINLAINLITAVTSGLLLVFLFGYFDGTYARTHQPTPGIIYPIYLFLGLVAAWQFLSFIIGMSLKGKLSGGKRGTGAPAVDENALSNGATQKSLPQADFENIVRTSVTEDTTKILDKMPRK